MWDETQRDTDLAVETDISQIDVVSWILQPAASPLANLSLELFDLLRVRLNTNEIFGLWIVGCVQLALPFSDPDWQCYGRDDIGRRTVGRQNRRSTITRFRYRTMLLPPMIALALSTSGNTLLLRCLLQGPSALRLLARVGGVRLIEMRYEITKYESIDEGGRFRAAGQSVCANKISFRLLTMVS